jgi:hypothetical protein
MQKTVTILNGQSLSGAVDFGVIARLVGIQMPAAWTAASITFQVSQDNVTYQVLIDDAGNEVTVTAPTANKTTAFRNDLKRIMARYQFLKIQSGTSGAPTAQGADRILTLLADTPVRV